MGVVTSDIQLDIEFVWDVLSPDNSRGFCYRCKYRQYPSLFQTLEALGLL